MAVEDVTISEQSVGAEGVVLIKIAGPLDARNFAKLNQAVEDAIRDRKLRAIFDLSGVNFIASCCIGPFLALSAEAGRNGGLVVIIALRAPVELVFDSLGLFQHLLVASDLAHALPHFKPK